MSTLLTILTSCFLSWLTYKVVQSLNKEDEKLELNPIVHACIAFLFGFAGICCSAGYIAVKAYKVSKEENK